MGPMHNQFGDPGEAPIPRPLGEAEWIEVVRAREVAEEKTAETASKFWRYILGGLHSEWVDRFDEAGYRGDPNFRPFDS